jgi:hypothetical protein
VARSHVYEEEGRRRGGGRPPGGGVRAGHREKCLFRVDPLCHTVLCAVLIRDGRAGAAAGCVTGGRDRSPELQPCLSDVHLAHCDVTGMPVSATTPQGKFLGCSNMRLVVKESYDAYSCMYICMCVHACVHARASNSHIYAWRT